VTGRYAATTEVPADRSRAEIETVLRRYGADQFVYGWDTSTGRPQAMVQFRASQRLIRIVVPMPNPDDPEFTLTATGRERSTAAAEKEWEQATRARWRALLLVIKAKLEAVAVDIATFDDEFLAYTVLPDGSTAGQWIAPQIDAAYATGLMPSALPELGPGS
jgi:hypothetical protein